MSTPDAASLDQQGKVLSQSEWKGIELPRKPKNPGIMCLRRSRQKIFLNRNKVLLFVIWKLKRH